MHSAFAYRCQFLCDYSLHIVVITTIVLTYCNQQQRQAPNKDCATSAILLNNNYLAGVEK